MKLLELKIEDLQKNPFWSYNGKNDNDALIKPILINQIENDVTYIAKTNFKLMDGTILLGYCSPEDDSGLDYTQPTIIYENKHINLFEIESNTNYKRILSEILNKNSEKIFPIMIECLIKERGINYSIKFK